MDSLRTAVVTGATSGIGREVVAVALGADDAHKQPARRDLAGIIEDIADLGVEAALYEPVGKALDQLFQKHQRHLFSV